MAKLKYEIHLDVGYVKRIIRITEEGLFMQIFDDFDELESILNTTNIKWQ